MHRLKWFLVCGAILLLSLPLISQAEFKVGKIIKVDKADWAPFLGPLRWSPKGDRIAFWTGNELRLADTTGAVVYSKTFDKPPFRYEWVDDSTICIGQMYWISPGKQYNGLVLLDLTTSHVRSLAEEQRTGNSDGDAGHVYIDGPYLSVENHVYYKSWSEKWNDRGRLQTSQISRPLVTSGATLSSVDDHFIQWDTSGISVINLDGRDTVRMGKPGSKGARGSISLAARQPYSANGEVVVRVADNSPILLNKNSLRIPIGFFGCGALYHSFANQFSEIAFQMTCDSAEPVTTDQVAVLNLQTMATTYLQDVFHCKQSLTPVFSPDGLRLALIVDDSLAIVWRREEQ